MSSFDLPTLIFSTGYILLFLSMLYSIYRKEYQMEHIPREEEPQKKDYDLRKLFVEEETRNGKDLQAIATDALDLGQKSLLNFVITKMSVVQKLEFLEYTFVNRRHMGASVVLNSFKEGDLHRAMFLLYRKNLIGTPGFVASELGLYCGIRAKLERMEVISYAAKNELSVKKLSEFSSSSIFTDIIDAALLVSDYCGHKAQLDSIVLHVSRGHYVYRENKALIILLPLIITGPVSMLTWKAASDSIQESFKIQKSIR